MSAYYLNAHILFVFLQFYHIVSAGRTVFAQMLLIYGAEIGVLFLIFARYLEHIDLIKLEKSEGC